MKKAVWAIGAVALVALAVAAPSRNEPVAKLRRGASVPELPVAATPERVTRVAAAAARPIETREVFRARWGASRGELGRRGANESNPEGPMSFAVDPGGRAFVLDQVNGRVQIFEPGREPRTVPLPGDTYQDVALGKDDGLVLLDRLSKEAVAFADARGRITHEIPLAGEGVAEAGDVTGLFQESDGTWVEVKHANLVKIADESGAPLDDREIVQGRFGLGGGVLRASKSGSHAAFVAERSSAGVKVLAKVTFDLPVWQLLELDTDRAGRVFLGASLLEEGTAPPFEVADEREVVVVLDAAGSELRRLELPASSGPEESFRRMRVGADGAFYHLAYDERGATLRRYAL